MLAITIAILILLMLQYCFQNSFRINKSLHSILSMAIIEPTNSPLPIYLLEIIHKIGMDDSVHLHVYGQGIVSRYEG